MGRKSLFWILPKSILSIHSAMEMAGEGDVLVVSNEGDDKRALIGEVMMT